MMVSSKPLVRRRHEKCFWHNRDICTNFWNCKLFAHYFRLNLAGCSLRIVRIEIQLRVRETSYVWIRPGSVKKFQMVHILKYRKSLLAFFSFKNLDEKLFFLPILSQTKRGLRSFFDNMIRTVKICDCYYTRKIFLWIGAYLYIRS